MTRMLAIAVVQRLLLLLLLQRRADAAAAFTPRTSYFVRSSTAPSSSISNRAAATTTTTTLFYKDDGGGKDIHNNQQQQTGHADTISIPVLGPLPGQAPLLIGAEFTLEPTPLQWQAVEETIRIHQKASQPHVGDNNSNNATITAAAGAGAGGDDDATPTPPATTAASIQAAPLIAIMDEYTAQKSPHHHQQQQHMLGRYATIAAVVGIGGSSSSSSSNDKEESTDDSSSSSSLSSKNSSSRTAKTVRLLGVGRALLKDFFYQVPTSLVTDEEGHLLTESGERLSDMPLHGVDNNDNNNINHELPPPPPPPGAAAANDPAALEQHLDNNRENHDDDDDDDDNPYANDSPMNIVMANFCVMNDTYLRHVKSPVHAVAAMSALAFKLQFLHEDRRKLVAGIQAAVARLKQAHQRRQAEAVAALQTASVEEEEEEVEAEEQEELIDHDGIGRLFETKVQDATAAVLFKPKLKRVKKKKDYDQSGAAAAATPPPSPPPPSLKQSSPVAKLDNYGLGSQAASFSAVPDLTNVYLEKLQPYYSPARCASEEHYYEVLSFVSILALEPFLEPTQTGWSLQCLNTLERMEQAYEWMWNHVRMLKEEVERLSEDLRQCGEECTDLW